MAECRAWTSVELAHDGPLPSDGVIVLAAAFGEGAAPIDTDLGAIYVEVSGEGGVLVNGVLELVESPMAVIWRPDAPLIPGLTYDVAVSVDNSVFGDEGFCAEPMLGSLGSVMVGPPGLPATAVPGVVAEESLFAVDELDLGGLVCCDGALPALEMCGTADASWSRGFCAPTSERWMVEVTMNLDGDALAAAGGQIGVVGWVPGTTARAEVFAGEGCFEPAAVNFATGEVVDGDPICVSARSAAALGSAPIDPTDALASACVGAPYTCAVAGEAWDPDACEPWPGDGESAGTGTGSSGGEGSSGGATTGSASGTASGGVTTSGGDASTGAGSSSADASAGSGGELDDGGGCGCRATERPASVLAWLLLGAGFCRRRRR